MVDYSKFDNIDVSDDEEEQPLPPTGGIRETTLPFPSAAAVRMIRNCKSCGKLNAKKKCGKCLFAHYCGTECQTKDWLSHKKDCKNMASWRVKEEIYLTAAEASECALTLRMGAITAYEIDRSHFLSTPFNLDQTPASQMKTLHEKFDRLVKESIVSSYEAGAINLLTTRMEIFTRSIFSLHFDSPKTLFSVMQHLLGGDIFDPSGGFMGFCCPDDNLSSAQMYNDVATVARNRGKTVDDISYTIRTDYINEKKQKSFLMSVMYK